MTDPAEPGHAPETFVDTSVVARSTRHTALAQVLTQGVRFLTNVALARILSPRDFGIVAIAFVVMMLLDQLRDVGTGSAVIQRPTIDQVLLNTVFLLNIALAGVLAVILYFGAGPLATLLGNHAAASVLKVFALLTLVTALGQLHGALLRREMRFGRVAIMTSTSALTTAAISIGGAIAGMNYWALVAGTAAGVVVNTALAWAFSSWRPSRAFSLASLQSIWRYSWHLFLSNILYFVFTQVDKVIVSTHLGAVPLGGYSLAQRTVSVPIATMGTVVGDVTFPAFSRRQGDDAALRSGFVRSSAVIALVTFPLMFGLAAAADPLVQVVFGSKWAFIVPFVVILAPIGAVQSVTFNSAQILLAKGRSDWSYRWGVVYCIVLITFELISVRWGAAGVAGGYAAGVLLLTPFSLLLAFRLIGLPLREYARAMAPHLGISLAMAFCVLALRFMIQDRTSDLVELVASVALGATVFAGLMWLVRPPAVHDAWLALREKRG